MHHNVIAVYADHNKALEALNQLKESGFSSSEIGLLGKTDADDPLQSKSITSASKGMAIGVIGGPILGALTGLGVFAIPGLGFLFGAGIFVGALAGLDFGLIGGGIISTLLLNSDNEELASIYEDYLHDGKTLLVVKSTASENQRAYNLFEEMGGFENLQNH